MLTLRERETAFRDPNLKGMCKRQIFRHYFEKRYRESSTDFWAHVKGRKIRPGDIARLSRFRLLRERAKQTLSQNQDEMSAWLAAQPK